MVPVMDLETRVAALETELADFRAGNDSQHHDMRVEYRGWAEHAVHAHEKLTTAKEMMHLILTDVREIKQTHGKKLDEHSRILGEHGRKLDEQGRILGEHSRILGEHSQKLDNLGSTVDTHTTLLREILAKVS
jgi:hypothetical protein